MGIALILLNQEPLLEPPAKALQRGIAVLLLKHQVQHHFHRGMEGCHLWQQDMARLWVGASLSRDQ